MAFRKARRAAELLGDETARGIFRNNLLKEFSYTHGLLKSLGHPRVYQLETTSDCPYTCIMCPRTHAMTRENGQMDIGLFRNILSQLQPAWQADDVRESPSLNLFHFGEPMMYRHFAESISCVHSRGLRACISTNPSIWTPQRIDMLLDVGVDEIYVMVDGMDDETSMAIRGRAASYVRGEANIRTLLAKKVRRGLTVPVIHINMIRQLRNAHQWQAFRDYWSGMEGVDRVVLSEYSAFAANVSTLVTIGDEFAAKDAEQALAVSRHATMSQYPCYYPWHRVAITWDGKVVPCCRDHNASTVLGDLTKASLEEVWNDLPMQDLRRQFVNARVTAAPCITCRERSYETGLPGKNYPFSGIGLRRLHAAVTGRRFP